MLRMQSTVTADGHLELVVDDVPSPEPGPDEVLIRVEAAPINPSDLGLLFGGADMATAEAMESGVRASVPPEAMAMMGPRLGRAMPCGNEGAGVAVAAGPNAAAQALVGKTVATWGGSMYAQFKVAPSDQCLVLHEGTTAAEGASCFVNPLTVLGMVETMRLEGHTALAHTAAASNLGQMLQKVCTNEGIALVNIVRRREHMELLRGLGAEHVVDSSTPSFREDLTAALAETGATLAFDATGGGRLKGRFPTHKHFVLHSRSNIAHRGRRLRRAVKMRFASPSCQRGSCRSITLSVSPVRCASRPSWCIYAASVGNCAHDRGTECLCVGKAGPSGRRVVVQVHPVDALQFQRRVLRQHLARASCYVHASDSGRWAPHRPDYGQRRPRATINAAHVAEWSSGRGPSLPPQPGNTRLVGLRRSLSRRAPSAARTHLRWVATRPATLRHPSPLLPLLPSGPGGVHSLSSRRDRLGHRRCPSGADASLRRLAAKMNHASSG